jgi:cell fate (sporulation/competence/biofilm development) regulator YlbF (YheA/YmcA/DUF963 family)
MEVLLMSKVIRKAEKLADAILESEEYEGMAKAEKVMDSDKRAAELVEKVEALQKKIDQNKQDEKFKKEMSSLQKTMWENEKIKSFMQKQQSFSKLMSKVNKKISQAINPQDSHHDHEHK